MAGNLFQTFLEKKQTEKKLTNEELIQKFQEARQNNDYYNEDRYFDMIYKRTNKSVEMYKSFWFENYYPWYNEELEAEFKFQLLRRISDYWNVMLENQWKKRWQKLWSNWRNNTENQNFNLSSIAFAIAKSLHVKTIYKFNDKMTSLQDIKNSWKNKQEVSYLNSFSDIESQLNNWSWDSNIAFDLEDKNENNKYNYQLLEAIQLIRKFYLENQKRLYTLFKKEIRKDRSIDMFDRLEQVLENILYGINDQKTSYMIEDIQKRDEKLYMNIKNLFI